MLSFAYIVVYLVFIQAIISPKRGCGLLSCLKRQTSKATSDQTAREISHESGATSSGQMEISPSDDSLRGPLGPPQLSQQSSSIVSDPLYASINSGQVQDLLGLPQVSSPSSDGPSEHLYSSIHTTQGFGRPMSRESSRLSEGTTYEPPYAFINSAEVSSDSESSSIGPVPEIRVWTPEGLPILAAAEKAGSESGHPLRVMPLARERLVKKMSLIPESHEETPNPELQLEGTSESAATSRQMSVISGKSSEDAYASYRETEKLPPQDTESASSEYSETPPVEISMPDFLQGVSAREETRSEPAPKLRVLSSAKEREIKQKVLIPEDTQKLTSKVEELHISPVLRSTSETSHTSENPYAASRETREFPLQLPTGHISQDLSLSESETEMPEILQRVSGVQETKSRTQMRILPQLSVDWGAPSMVPSLQSSQDNTDSEFGNTPRNPQGSYLQGFVLTQAGSTTSDVHESVLGSAKSESGARITEMSEFEGGDEPTVMDPGESTPISRQSSHESNPTPDDPYAAAEDSDTKFFKFWSRK